MREILLFMTGGVIMAMMFPSILYAGDISLCRNVVLQDPVDFRQVRECRDRISDAFRPGDRVTAVFVFLPPAPDGTIEFRWARRLEMQRAEERRHVHVFRNADMKRAYIAYSWVIFGPSFFDMFLGSKDAGDWSVEVLMNGKRKDERRFIVKHD